MNLVIIKKFIQANFYYLKNKHQQYLNCEKEKI